MSSEMKFTAQRCVSSHGHIKTEDFIEQCKTDVGAHEADTKVHVGQEPCLLETKLKSESEVSPGSGAHIKSELAPFSSVFVLKHNYNKHGNDHELDTKIKIKEEPGCLEETAELKPESEWIHVKGADLQFDTKNNASEGDTEFMLPDARLNTEGLWSYESDVTSAGLDRDRLKQKN